MTFSTSLLLAQTSITRADLNADDIDLIARAQDGDDAAFEQLVYRHTPALYRVVRRMTPDDAEAEAIVQEAFLRTWMALPRYRNDRPFFPYLVTVATNLARDRWRKARWLNDDDVDELADSLADPGDLPESLVEDAETLAMLAEAVTRLPAPYRTVIALRYDAELSYEEIANALDLPINTVRTHLHRAKARLRRMLEEQLT